MRSITMTVATGAVAAGALALSLAAGSAHAADTADFAGKTVTVYIGFGPSGGYDLYGRLAARHLGDHIPGHPAVVVKNMPGAGGFTMTGWLYNAAPKDGTALGVAPQQIAIEQAIGTRRGQYDAGKFTWIGRMSPIVEISYTWKTSPTKTLEDARKRVTVMGASSPDSPTATHLYELNTLAGTKFKVITGFRDANEAALGVERGEVEGTTKSWASMKVTDAAWLRDGDVHLLVQYAMHKSPDLPNVPTMMELGKSPLENEALKMIASGNELGRSLFAPPGLSAAATKTLRGAYAAMMKDKGLIADAKKTKLELGALSGAGLQKLVDDTLAAPPEVIKLVLSTRSAAAQAKAEANKAKKTSKK